MERSRECRADGCPPLAQHNLLYAVSFLRFPEEMDAFSFARAAGVRLLKLTSNAQSPSTSLENPTSHFAHPRIQLPYYTLSPRWNRVLDLAAHKAQALDAMDISAPAGGYPSILLEPASTFPVFATNPASSSHTHYNRSSTPSHTAGSTPQASSRWSTLIPVATLEEDRSKA